jgi:hypothetical protein
MTKDEARQIAIRQWRELPLENQVIENAVEFAKLIAPALEFDTLGNREKIIAAWLIRDAEARIGPEVGAR